jgi:hypothetical protein
MGFYILGFSGFKFQTLSIFFIRPEMRIHGFLGFKLQTLSNFFIRPEMNKHGFLYTCGFWV